MGSGLHPQGRGCQIIDKKCDLERTARGYPVEGYSQNYSPTDPLNRAAACMQPGLGKFSLFCESIYVILPRSRSDWPTENGSAGIPRSGEEGIESRTSGQRIGWPVSISVS